MLKMAIFEAGVTFSIVLGIQPLVFGDLNQTSIREGCFIDQ